jgi:hypothetical protein
VRWRRDHRVVERRRIRELAGGTHLRAGAAREAEVGEARATVGADDNVVGFDVAVNHAGRVHRGKAARDVDEHSYRLAPRSRLFGPCT